MSGADGPAPDRGVYGISVAAELVGVGVQSLRQYEAQGLLDPARTEGGTRRYSTNDVQRLRRISDLLDAGLNLAGIGMVLDLEAQNTLLGAREGGSPMITDRIDPTDEVPEADLLEQRTPDDPRAHDAETGRAIPEALPDGVDEADALDQHTAIPDTDEDDYPHQSLEPQWP